MSLSAGLVDLAAVRRSPDWQRWRSLSAHGRPYLSPEFFALVAPLVPEGPRLVAESWSHDGVQGVLPLALHGDVLRALRSDHSPAYDYAGSLEGMIAIWRALRGDRRWNELVLDKVPADSPLATMLPRLARDSGCPAVVRPDGSHPYLPLRGFEARISSKFRSNLVRCERRAGALMLERIPSPTHADLDAAVAIEAMGWKSAAGTSIASDPRVEHLYHALGRWFGPRHGFSLYFLRAAGVRIATLFALEDGRTLHALKIGHDPRHAHLGPGHLLVWKVAADAEGRGLHELDFAGREDEWKRKWTSVSHPLVRVIVYRFGLRGLGRHLLRDQLKPRLPPTMRDTPRSPLPRHCQRADALAAHGAIETVRVRLARGLGIRSGLRRWLSRRPPAPPLGDASAFAEGTWVRVLDADAVRATLDARQRLRGLAFTPAQWEACGRVFRVAQHVRRVRDDHGRFRPVHRTVLLDGVDCGEEPVGCGRHCPLWFRDEWLVTAETPRPRPLEASQARHARVRDLADIAAGLDLFGRRDGLTFMPEMAAWCGKRLAVVQRLGRVYEHDRWVAPRGELYVLAGASCSGAVCGGRGPCDRRCPMIWHADWLILEAPPP